MPVAIEGERLPTEVSYDAKLQSGLDPGEDNEQADEPTAKFSKMPLEEAYGREISIPGGHSCSQHVNCTLPQNLRHL